MCGFFFSTIDNFEASQHGRLIARGPDAIKDVTVNGCRLVHTHLSIFSEQHEQPFIDSERELALMFNGEIYNCPADKTESHFIIQQYSQFGLAGFKNLDGEFAIVIVDFSNDELIFATDPFGTKPCFYSASNGLHVSSYPSSIARHGINPDTIFSARPNTAYRYSLKTRQLVEVQELIQWNLEQFATSFEGWTEAFNSAVWKRVNHMRSGHIPFVGISSGYDSGAIHSCLLNQDHEFLGISLLGKEDANLLVSRQSLSTEQNVRHLVVDHFRAKEIAIEQKHVLKGLVEDLEYHIVSDARRLSGEPQSVLQDKGSVGLAIVATIARQNNSLICISGSGADEIISDYGFGGRPIYQHSNFGGHWPDNLSNIFPWASFYGSTQQAYIRKEEAIGGAYGIETRYPFLDKAVVQAWLNISPKLKNQEYKSCIANYLRNNAYPFKVEKKGFSPWAA